MLESMVPKADEYHGAGFISVCCPYCDGRGFRWYENDDDNPDPRECRKCSGFGYWFELRPDVYSAWRTIA
jgi:hypothetical protein